MSISRPVVIADATPLHYLILIDQIAILRELYNAISIPEAVVDELSDQHTPVEVSRWIAALPAWATIVTAPTLLSLPFPSLGQGEREAIALAQRSHGSLLLTDDLQARIAAETLGIQVVPTIRILATAAALSLVDFEESLSRLQQTNFRLSRKIVERIRRSPSGPSTE